MIKMELQLPNKIAAKLKIVSESLPKKAAIYYEGKVVKMVGLTLEVVGVNAPVGSLCQISIDDNDSILAEVVGFSGKKLYLMPLDKIHNLKPGARVSPLISSAAFPVGPQLLGRIINARGEPIDNKGPLHCSHSCSLYSEVINPLKRDPIRQPLDVGVRAINSLITVGKGQRIGLFAGSGVGKSVLLGMMTKYTEADVIVVGLIGERGREVREFIEDNLGEKGLEKCVVVAAPADESPLNRLHGAYLATSIAEYFRDQNKQVLLLVDSLTRFAQAQREISLSVGELPATKGYTPSVFAKLPELIERAGTSEQGKGAITAFYTVLVEGDNMQDPIGDAARAILDGHVVLSRTLADSGHYPAIEIESSISRVMVNVTTPEHQKLALLFKKLYSAYSQNRDLIQVGAYQNGADAVVDMAIKMIPRLRSYLQQGMQESIAFDISLQELGELLKGIEQ
jgi:flagellum-specific ATP synthase